MKTIDINTGLIASIQDARFDVALTILFLIIMPALVATALIIVSRKTRIVATAADRILDEEREAFFQAWLERNGSALVRKMGNSNSPTVPAIGTSDRGRSTPVYETNTRNVTPPQSVDDYDPSEIGDLDELQGQFEVIFEDEEPDEKKDKLEGSPFA